MKIKYELKDFDGKKIISKFGMDKEGKTRLFFSNTCFIRMVKYVPWKTGALATTVTVKPNSITYEQPYAHRQYTQNKGKHGRGKYWDRTMMSHERDKIAQEVEAYAKMVKG